MAAAAMAALSASQAPGFLPVAHAAAAPQHEQTAVTPPPGPAIDGGSPYITGLPPLNTPTGPVTAPTPGATPGTPVVAIPGGGGGLPATVLAAYQRAEESVAQSNPGCHLPWQLLAAIGQVESGQARGGSVDANGTTYAPILGPVLNGNGFANISDTDGGAYDGDALHDRAVGPMQFIPSTWATWGADGNGDGVRNPNNVYDAALAAAHYLCADGRDLAVPAEMDRAILGYNHSQAYLNLVRNWYDHFIRGGTGTVPDRPATPYAPPSDTASAPPVPGGTATPAPSATQGSGTVSPAPGHTAKPSTGPTTPPSSGGGTGTGGPTTGPTGTPTTPPTTGTPTTPPTTGTPTTPPTTPGCTPDSPTPAPTDSGSATPTPTTTPTATPSDSPTGDPCPTDTPTPAGSGTPTTTPTGGAATGAALKPTS